MFVLACATALVLAGSALGHDSFTHSLDEPTDAAPAVNGWEKCAGLDLDLDVALDTPADGAHIAGTSYDITWTTSGTNAGSAEQYGIWFHDGTDWIEIIEDTGNPETHTWDTTTVADDHDFVFYVFVYATDALLTNCYDFDWNNNTVIVDNTAPSSYSISAPSTGDVVGGTVDVAWSGTETNPDVVELEYSDDGGGTWTQIEASTADDGSYAWDASGLADGDAYQLRLTPTDEAGNTGSAVTTGNFTIDNTPPSSYSIDAPGDGTYQSGTITIEWSGTEANPDVVRIELSTDGGTSWSDLAASTPDDGAYDWDTTTISDGSQVRLRVTPTDQAGNVGTAAVTQNFTVDNTPPVVDVTAPVSGAVGGTTDITWDSTEANKDVVQIEITDDGGSTWTTLAASTPDDGSFSWDTTTFSDGTYQVRITATDLAGHTDTDTGASFDVDNTAPVTDLTAPSAGDVVGGTVSIAWSTADAHPDVVHIEKSDDGGSTWSDVTASTADDGSFDWDASALADGDTYRLRVTPTDAAGNVGDAVATGNFTIDNTAPSGYSIDAPADGSFLRGTVSIDWSGTEAHKDVVRIEVSTDGGSSWSDVVASTADDGSFSWDTTTVADGSQVRLRLTATDQAGNVGAAVNTSDMTVDNTAPVVDVTAPTSGVVNGTSVDITWDSTETNKDVVDIEVSDDGGSTWTTLVASTADDGSHTWDTTAVADGTYQVRVTATDLAGNSGADTGGSFDVDNTAPSTDVTAPSAGDVVGDSVSITWDTTDAHPDIVKIEYSDDGGSTWTTLEASTADDGSYTWDTSALTEGDSYRLRITPTDVVGHVGAAAITGDFTLDLTAPVVDVTQPDGSDTLSGTVDVTWDSTEAHKDVVRIEVSDDGGSTWTTVVSSTADDGSYSWDTTSVADGTYTLRVTATDLAGNVGSDVSASFDVDNPESDGGDDSDSDPVDDGDDGPVVTQEGSATSFTVTVEGVADTDEHVLVPISDQTLVELNLTFDPDYRLSDFEVLVSRVGTSSDVEACGAAVPEGAYLLDVFHLDLASTSGTAFPRGTVAGDVTLRVDPTRAAAQEFTDRSVVLYHCVDGAWETLPAEPAGSVANVHRFRVGSFSPFAFGYAPAQTTDDGSGGTGDGAGTTDDGDGTVPPSIPLAAMVPFAIVILVGAGGLLVLAMMFAPARMEGLLGSGKAMARDAADHVRRGGKLVRAGGKRVWEGGKRLGRRGVEWLRNLR